MALGKVPRDRAEGVQELRRLQKDLVVIIEGRRARIPP